MVSSYSVEDEMKGDFEDLILLSYNSLLNFITVYSLSNFRTVLVRGRNYYG